MKLRAILITSALASTLLLTTSSSAEAANCGWDTSKGWITRENAKPGTPKYAEGIPRRYSGDYSRRDSSRGFNAWVANSVGAKRVEGWLDQVSATCGQTVGLHISGNAVPVKISVFRMGFYRGDNARLIEKTSTAKPIPAYDAPKISAAPRSTVTTNWPVSWKFTVDSQTPPGQYIIRLDDGIGKSTLVPFTITNPKGRSETTFVSAVMTWQAYNQWGGFSLYKGPNLLRTTRATVVSFDRPYDGDGSGQARYMEFPIIRLAEEKGIDLNFITDYELDAGSPEVRNATTLVLGGHDEYWTNNMRKNLQDAVDHGTNLIIFGGNTGYNRIRIEGDRKLAMWRSTKSDPYGTVKDKATTAWRMSPIKQPESLLLGSQYIGLGASGDYKITHPDRWPFNVMKTPQLLRLVVGREVDSPLYSPGPAVESLATSEITVYHRKAIAMATYYNSASGAGVIDIGTNGWPCLMSGICPWHSTVPMNVREDVRLVTENILVGASHGPLAKFYPAKPDIPARTKSTLRAEAS